LPFTTIEKATSVAVIQHCNYSESALYCVDAHFSNTGTFLGSSDVPSLTVIPIMFPLFGSLLLSWVIHCLIRHRNFLKIHLCLIAILAFYLIYLIFCDVALANAAKNDEDGSW
jgi:hypothetical protein